MAFPTQRFELGAYQVWLSKLESVGFQWEGVGKPTPFADLRVSRHPIGITEEHWFIRHDTARLPTRHLDRTQALALVFEPKNASQMASLPKLRASFKDTSGPYNHYVRGVVYGQSPQGEGRVRTPWPEALTWRGHSITDDNEARKGLYEPMQTDAGGVELFMGGLRIGNGTYHMDQPAMHGSVWRGLAPPAPTSGAGLAPATGNLHDYIEHWVGTRVARIGRSGKQAWAFRGADGLESGTADEYHGWRRLNLQRITGTFTKIRYYRIVEIPELRTAESWCPRFDPEHPEHPPLERTTPGGQKVCVRWDDNINGYPDPD